MYQSIFIDAIEANKRFADLMSIEGPDGLSHLGNRANW